MSFSQHPQATTRVALALLLSVAFVSMGCAPQLEPRVYDAPKIATEFVKEPPELPSRRPMMLGNNIPLENRRILGAAIPATTDAFFLKSTDTIDRLNMVASDFRTVVEKFDIDPSTRELRCELPNGWSLRWREKDIALAELNVDVPLGKPVQFTITQLPRPSSIEAWPQYLLENINRWRGQLSLPKIELSKMQQEVAVVPRVGSTLPGYVFDARGSNTNDDVPDRNNTTTDPKRDSQSSTSPTGASTLRYDRPASWTEGAARPPRLATFTFGESNHSGEVAVSKANNSPVANATMWFQQIMSDNNDALAKELAEKAVHSAEEISAGSIVGKLYTIRSQEPSAQRGFLVAAIPTSENECIFVKVVSDPQSLDEQKPNLIRFVNSLRWE